MPVKLLILRGDAKLGVGVGGKIMRGTEGGLELYCKASLVLSPGYLILGLCFY